MINIVLLASGNSSISDPTTLVKQILGIWWSLPIGGLLILLIYFLMHPEKVEAWSGILARLFASFSRKSERHSVSADIQSKISSYIQNNQLKDILPYGLKFQWVTGEDFSSYVNENEVIVIMDYHKNNAKNFINAIMQYTSKALLPQIRNEIPTNIMIAMELIVQEKIIQEKRPDALDDFRINIIPQKCFNDAIKKFRERLQELDKSGYFDNVFLSEVAFAGARLGDFKEVERWQEFEKLLELLEWILTRSPEDESKPLYYEGKVFHIWMILVAKPIKIIVQGVSPYIKRAREASSKKFDSIYVVGREQNMPHVQKVVDEIEREKIANLIWVREFKTRDRNRKRKQAKMALFRT